MDLATEHEERHPDALGVSPSRESPFVTWTGSTLAITRVLTDKGPRDVRSLQSSAPRPRVYCPFCGRKGVYRKSNTRLESFAHAAGNEECVAGDLADVLHRRAIQLLLRGLAELRRRGQPLNVSLNCGRCSDIVPHEILSAGGWTEEISERRMALPEGKYRLPDIRCVNDSTSVAVIEVKRFHAVDDLRLADLAMVTAGVEVDAQSLFGKEGEPLWNYSQPLPEPRKKWNMEKPPRRFVICQACRKPTPDFEALAVLVRGAADERGPRVVDEELRASVAAPSSNTDAITLLRALYEEPESLRDEAPARAEEAAKTPLKALVDTKGVARSLLGWNDWGPWNNLALQEILKNPLSPLQQSLSRIDSFDAQSYDESLKRIEIDLDRADQLLRWTDGRKHEQRVPLRAQVELMRHAARTGSTAIPAHELFRRVARRTKIAIGEIRSVITNTPQPLTYDAQTGLVGLPIFGEHSLANGLLKRLKMEHVRSSPKCVDAGLTDEQHSAVKSALASRFFVLTGGPGTGKSRTLRAIVESTEGMCWMIAPTNKALGRLREVLGGMPERVWFNTVAKCVESTTGFRWDGEKVSPPNFDKAHGATVIIDEAGCIDSQTFRNLMWGIAKANRIILSGDTNQLPSIGPGAVLRDLLDSDIVRRAELMKVHRVGSNRGLVDFAAAIRNGGPLKQCPGVALFDCEELDLVRTVEDIYAQLRAHGQDVQVITPLNAMRIKLNSTLQRACNQNGAAVSGLRRLRDGDPVIYKWKPSSPETSDEPQESLPTAMSDTGEKFANGETGTLLQDTDGIVLRTSAGTRRRVSKTQLQSFDLAYAVTVHASQGSEWPHVIVAVPPSRSGFVSRELLYTAATRAKESLTMVGCLETMQRACRNVSLASRQTLLGAALHRNAQHTNGRALP